MRGGFFDVKKAGSPFKFAFLAQKRRHNRLRLLFWHKKRGAIVCGPLFDSKKEVSRKKVVFLKTVKTLPDVGGAFGEKGVFFSRPVSSIRWAG